MNTLYVLVISNQALRALWVRKEVGYSNALVTKKEDFLSRYEEREELDDYPISISNIWNCILSKGWEKVLKRSIDAT